MVKTQKCKWEHENVTFLCRCQGHAFPWVFTVRPSNASAVLGVVILSVRPSVCHMRIVTKPNNALRIFWYHAKGNHSSFLNSDTNSGWWPTLHSDWTLRHTAENDTLLQHCTGALQQISNKRNKPALLRGVKN